MNRNNPPDWAADSALFMACKQGRLEAAKKLLSEPRDRNYTQNGFSTALMKACKFGEFAGVVRDLIKAGFDVNHEDNAQRTPLIIACNWNNVEIATILLKAGADANCQTKIHLADQGIVTHYTPLKLACVRGNTQMVELLLIAGASVNVKGEDRSTAINAAFFHRRYDIVRILIDHGANIDMDYFREHSVVGLSDEIVAYANMRRLYRKWREAVRVRPYIMHWIKDYADRRYDPDSVGVLHPILISGGKKEEAKRMLEQETQKEFVRILKRKISAAEIDQMGQEALVQAKHRCGVNS